MATCIASSACFAKSSFTDALILEVELYVNKNKSAANSVGTLLGYAKREGLEAEMEKKAFDYIKRSGGRDQ